MAREGAKARRGVARRRPRSGRMAPAGPPAPAGGLAGSGRASPRSPKERCLPEPEGPAASRRTVRPFRRNAGTPGSSCKTWPSCRRRRAARRAGARARSRSGTGGPPARPCRPPRAPVPFAMAWGDSIWIPDGPGLPRAALGLTEGLKTESRRLFMHLDSGAVRISRPSRGLALPFARASPPSGISPAPSARARRPSGGTGRRPRGRERVKRGQ